MERRVTAMQQMAFDEVIDILEGMHPRRRRSHHCWLKMQKLLLGTGNWKAAARGKPDIRHLAGSTTKKDDSFDAAY